MKWIEIKYVQIFMWSNVWRVDENFTALIITPNLTKTKTENLLRDTVIKDISLISPIVIAGDLSNIILSSLKLVDKFSYFS